VLPFVSKKLSGALYCVPTMKVGCVGGDTDMCSALS
jgi:hypothetical protein